MNVEKVLSKEVLSTNRIRILSRWTRQYTLAYYCINKEKERETGNENEKRNELTVASTAMKKTDANRPNQQTELTAQIIQRIVKGYKSHRDASDFDHGFIHGVVSRMSSSNEGLRWT